MKSKTIETGDKIDLQSSKSSLKSSFGIVEKEILEIERRQSTNNSFDQKKKSVDYKIHNFSQNEKNQAEQTIQRLSDLVTNLELALVALEKKFVSSLSNMENRNKKEVSTQKDLILNQKRKIEELENIIKDKENKKNIEIINLNKELKKLKQKKMELVEITNSLKNGISKIEVEKGDIEKKFEIEKTKEREIFQDKLKELEKRNEKSHQLIENLRKIIKAIKEKSENEEKEKVLTLNKEGVLLKENKNLKLLLGDIKKKFINLKKSHESEKKREFQNILKEKNDQIKKITINVKKRIKEMENTLKEKNNEIIELRENLKNRKIETKKMKEKLEVKDSKLLESFKVMKDKMEKKNDEVLKMNNYVKTIEKEVNDVKKIIESTNKTLEMKINEKDIALNKKESQLEEMDKIIDEFEIKEEKRIKEIELKEKKIERINKSLEDLMNENKKNKKIIINLKQDYQKVKGQNQRFIISNKQMKRNNLELSSIVKSLQKEKTELKEEIVNIKEGNRKKMNGEKKVFEGEIELVFEKIIEFVKTTLSLEGEIVSNDLTIFELMKKINGLNGTLFSISRDNGRILVEKNCIENNSMKERIKKMKKRVNQLIKEKCILEETIQKINETKGFDLKNNMEKEITNLKKELNDSKEGYETLKKRFEKFTFEYKNHFLV